MVIVWERSDYSARLERAAAERTDNVTLLNEIVGYVLTTMRMTSSLLAGQ